MTLEGINDYLKKRATQLGLERGDQLQLIQRELDRLALGPCRAVSLNDGTLKVVTTTASAASELRYNLPKILTTLSRIVPEVKRIRLQIGS
jgi:hypothetical protein